MNLTVDVRYKYQTISIGDQYGKLTVLALPKKDRRRTVDCRCVCGKIKSVASSHLIKSIVKSCGNSPCREVTKWSHGKYKTKTYSIWCAMKSRCCNEKSKAYHNYRGRGIKVCTRWLEKAPLGFLNFLEDMGEKPDNLTLDRIDVNGDYDPSNCRWATVGVQAFNQRLCSANTSGKTGVSWDKRVGKWHTYLSHEKKRMNLGWFKDLEVAITQRLVAELKYYGEFSGD